MAGSLNICDIDEDLKGLLKKFRFRKEKNDAAIVMKINTADMMIVLDEEYEDTSLEELQSELSAHQPRYVVYSYVRNHPDGRVSYPLCFIFVSPQGCKPEMQMMYAGSKIQFVNELGITKVYEIRNTEDLTEEWLLEKLSLHG